MRPPSTGNNPYAAGEGTPSPAATVATLAQHLRALNSHTPSASYACTSSC